MLLLMMMLMMDTGPLRKCHALELQFFSRQGVAAAVLLLLLLLLPLMVTACLLQAAANTIYRLNCTPYRSFAHLLYTKPSQCAGQRRS
jgi:hypothetical protein